MMKQIGINQNPISDAYELPATATLIKAILTRSIAVGMTSLGLALLPSLLLGLWFTFPARAEAFEGAEIDQVIDNTSSTLTAQAEPIEINTVQTDATGEGLILRLEANGPLESPITSTTENGVVITIPNAVLNSSDGDTLGGLDSTPGISSVTVANTSDNQVQITIIGSETIPLAEVRPGGSDLVISATPGAPATQGFEGDSIRIIVTGEEDAYFQPTASTATRTDTSLLDTPNSIQVIPRQILDDQQVIRLDEALTNVSGVSRGGTFSNTTLDFNIRGFEAPILRDGFREFGGFTGVSPTITNIERVEVLKGPASILYGEVQPGGLINLVTEQPLSEPSYQFDLDVGNRGVFQPQIDLSGPLNSDGSILYRLNASYFNDDGFIDFARGTERAFVAPILAFEIGDRTDLTVSAEYTNEQLPLENGLPARGPRVVDVPSDRSIVTPEDIIDRELTRINYRLEHRFSDNWRIRNAFEYSNQDLLDVGYIPIDFDASTGIVTSFAGRQDLDTENFSLQTNVVGEFTTGPFDHKLLVGVDLNRTENQEITGFDTFNPFFLDIFNPDPESAPAIAGDLPIIFDGFIKTDRLGVYLQDQIELLDNLILLAGVRYDTVDQTTTNNPNVFDPVGSETTRNDDDWTPRVGIVYQPTDFLSLFGSYSQSFTPTFGLDSSGEPLGPETGEGFEAGVKAELLDGNLFTTLSYFNIKRQNVETADPIDPFASVSTGEQRSEGVELDVVGEILPGWNIIASYAYIDGEVTEDNTIPEGSRLLNTPEHSANLWTTYEIQKGNLQGLGFGVGFNLVGEREGDTANTFELDSYFLTNAALFYRRDNWRLSLNAKNLFDIDYIAGSNNRRSSGSEAGPPFTILGSVSVEF